MELIDSHCHPKKFKDQGELPAVFERAAGADVSRIIAVGTSPDDWVPYREMHSAHQGKVDYTVGLHPCYVDEDWEVAVSQISTFFMPPNTPVAIGELGLDFFHLPKDPVKAGETILLQEEAMRQQLMLANELDCPIIIHSRDCFTECMKLLDESGVDWSRVVFHCFSYGPKEIRQINERGGRASFTGIVTYKSAENVREALREQGLERLMIETDCPYLTPEPHRGKPNEPAFLKHIAEHCAQALAIETEELATQSSQNTRRFFGLS